MKQILFNTDMVRGILDGHKTVTRRVVKPPALYAIAEDTDGNCVGSCYEDEHGAYVYPTTDDCPYCVGDILYVRETWAAWSRTMGTQPALYYKADEGAPDGIKWRPSIHMPKEAARIFLRVTDVRVERLQQITEEQAEAEGCQAYANYEGSTVPAIVSFSDVWNSTIKPADQALYGWNANPWVWVIGFERIGKKEAKA